MKKTAKLLGLAFLLLFPVLLAACSVSGASSSSDTDSSWQDVQSAGKLVIGLEDGFLPVSDFDADGARGFAAESALELCRRLGVEAEFVETAPEDALTMLADGEIDCVWAGSKTVLLDDSSDELSYTYVEGDEVILCDGAGTDADARVTLASPDRVELEILERRASAAEPSTRVTLYVGYPKQDKLEWIIQKGVELGAVRIVPFFSRYCVVQPKKEPEKNVRYNRIAAEAAKQSGRGILPTVELPRTFAQMLDELAGYDRALLCYEGGGEPLSRLVEKGQNIAIITGAEGGFSE